MKRLLILLVTLFVFVVPLQAIAQELQDTISVNPAKLPPAFGSEGTVASLIAQAKKNCKKKNKKKKKKCKKKKKDKNGSNEEESTGSILSFPEGTYTGTYELIGKETLIKGKDGVCSSVKTINGTLVVTSDTAYTPTQEVFGYKAIAGSVPTGKAKNGPQRNYIYFLEVSESSAFIRLVQEGIYNKKVGCRTTWEGTIPRGPLT